MPRRLFIVGRGNDRLYEDLRQQFSGNPDVEVLIDRRYAERRQSQTSHDPERRRSDRRDQGPAGGHVVSTSAFSPRAPRRRRRDIARASGVSRRARSRESARTRPCAGASDSSMAGWTGPCHWRNSRERPVSVPFTCSAGSNRRSVFRHASIRPHVSITPRNCMEWRTARSSDR